MRMEPTVRYGKRTKFYDYFGMGKPLAHDAIIGLCLHSRGPNAFAHMAAALRYFFQGNILIVVHNKVNPEAHVDFAECMDRFADACTGVGLSIPVAHCPDFVTDWKLEWPEACSGGDEEDPRLIGSWVELGVQKLRQFFFSGPLGSAVWQ